MAIAREPPPTPASIAARSARCSRRRPNAAVPGPAAGPRRPSGRKAVIGSVLPFTRSCIGGPYSIRLRVASAVAASQSTMTRSLPSPEVDRRAATLIESPMTMYSRRVSLPITTHSTRPLATPTVPRQPSRRRRVGDRQRGADAALRVVGVGVRRQPRGGQQARPVVVDADLVELRRVALEVGLQRDDQLLDGLQVGVVHEVREVDEDRRHAPQLGDPRPVRGGLVGDHRGARCTAPAPRRRDSCGGAVACGRRSCVTAVIT